MGQYCELYIADYPIATTKNGIDPYILSLFQPKDLKNFVRQIGERNQLLYGRGDYDDETEQAANILILLKTSKTVLK